MEKNLNALKTEMEASEQTKIDQIKVRYQNEIARCKNEIAELREANKVLMKRVNEIEQTSCQTENAENKSINRLMEENEGYNNVRYNK